MRIMHLLNHCAKGNGHVNVSIDLACTQARMGHTVGLCCAHGDFLDLLRDTGIYLYRVEEPHHNIPDFFRANWQLNRAIRAFRPDVLHAHMAAHSVLMQPYRLAGYKTVTTLHNEFDRAAWLMGLAHRVVTVSKSGYDAMHRRGVPIARLRYVQNGSADSPRLRRDFSVAALSRPAILTVCGMHPRKGIADLLQAFFDLHHTNPDAHLYLAGEGPMLEEFKQLAAGFGLDNSVTFLGFCDDPRQYLFSADIFVLASHADPGPLVIAEARNAGLAIIASAVDGIPAMLDDGEAGILVPPRRPDVMAAAMRRLLDEPSQLQHYATRAKLGAERFRVERVCLDMEKIYAELISDTRSPAPIPPNMSVL